MQGSWRPRWEDLEKTVNFYDKSGKFWETSGKNVGKSEKIWTFDKQS
jgi:hypothetical protein